MSVAQAVLLVTCYFMIRANRQAGPDLLFLDQKKLKQQFMWNIKMDQESIMQLIDKVQDLLKKEGFSDGRINRAALAIEESQMRDLALNKDPQKQVIECSLLLADDGDATLILRNTGICSNILDGKDTDPLPEQIVSGLFKNTGSYILVNGNNRLMFHI